MFGWLKQLTKKTADLPHVVIALTWQRPKTDEWVDLTEAQVNFINNTGTCPYCRSTLYSGPSGGASQNVYCGSRSCNSAFNVSEIIPWGQFIGTPPSDFFDAIAEE